MACEGVKKVTGGGLVLVLLIVAFEGEVNGSLLGEAGTSVAQEVDGAAWDEAFVICEGHSDSSVELGDFVEFESVLGA